VLILTRRVGETVMIGDEVTVTVLRVKGNQVRLGVNAPRACRSSEKRSFIASSAKIPSPSQAEFDLPEAPGPGGSPGLPKPVHFCPARPACV